MNAVEEAAEAADRLVGDTIVHVDQREVQRVHGQKLKYVKGGDSGHEKRTDDLAGCDLSPSPRLLPEHAGPRRAAARRGPGGEPTTGSPASGVVAAFLDSGFYAHRDLTQPVNRILEYVDLVGGRFGASRRSRSRDVSSWHGMMSSVVAGGNGCLSDGRYRSLAPEMQLVLVKVGQRRAHPA